MARFGAPSERQHSTHRPSNAPPGVKPARESPKWPNSPHAVVPLLRGAGAAAGRELGDHASLMPEISALRNLGKEKCSSSPGLATLNRGTAHV
jgi:hypothetical protein